MPAQMLAAQAAIARRRQLSPTSATSLSSSPLFQPLRRISENGSDTNPCNSSTIVLADASGIATRSGGVFNGLGTHTITASYAGIAYTFLASNGTGIMAVNQASIPSRRSNTPHLRTSAAVDAWVVRCTKSASRHGLQLKRIFNVLGAAKLTEAPRRA
jgi:hypothetical protein